MYLPPDQYIPQFINDRRPWIMWMAAAAGALLIIGLIVAAPTARANGFGLLALALYQSFSLVCHQAPERSFFVAGHQLAVCARCTGLYFGFAVAVMSYPLLRSLRTTQMPERKWLFIVAMPLAIDFSLGLLGIWENTHSSRFATAGLVGFVSVFYILPGLVEVVRRSKSWNSDWRASSQDREVIPTPISQTPITAPSDYSAPHRRI